MNRPESEKSRVRDYIRKTYGSIASGTSSCCAPAGNISTGSTFDRGCGCGSGATAADISRKIGYDEADLARAPAEANLGLGCGNPTAMANLREGEVVLDLGSGAGLDCFLAAGRVGPGGRVIGVDMTPEMIKRARANAASGPGIVEFRLGEIENLPLADASVDIIISNCVLNLSTDKQRAFSEMNRVLRPGGRLAISDIALLRELPAQVSESLAAYAGCVSGAMLEDDYRKLVVDAGFSDVTVNRHEVSLRAEDFSGDPMAAAFLDSLEPGESATDFIASVNVEAIKPE